MCRPWREPRHYNLSPDADADAARFGYWATLGAMNHPYTIDVLAAASLRSHETIFTFRMATYTAPDEEGTFTDLGWLVGRGVSTTR